MEMKSPHGRTAQVYMVHGEAMTVREAAERLGMPLSTLKHYIGRHHHKDGSRLTLEEAWDHYTAAGTPYNAAQPHGRPSRVYAVHGEAMTMNEAAERLGLKRSTLEHYLRHHKNPDGSRATLEEAYDRYTEAGGMLMDRSVRHMVHGERMTVRQAAERLGRPDVTLRTYMNRHRNPDGSRPTLEQAYDRYMAIAEGRQKANPPRLPIQHRVHGEWMTVPEAAARLGMSALTLKNWRYTHRRPDGRPALLEEAYDHFAGIRAGTIRRGHRLGRVYTVRGRRMTVSQAAERYGLKTKNLRNYIECHHCGLEAAVTRLEALKKERAVRAIMGIISGR